MTLRRHHLGILLALVAAGGELPAAALKKGHNQTSLDNCAAAGWITVHRDDRVTIRKLGHWRARNSSPSRYADALAAATPIPPAIPASQALAALTAGHGITVIVADRLVAQR